MVYHVIIALNSVGKRKVGEVISLLEKKGLEFVEIRKKSTSVKVTEFPDMKLLILQHMLDEMEAMEFYRLRFSQDVLKKKITHFYGNHVDLSLDSGEKSFNSNELWQDIVEYVFDGGKKLPIMFVAEMSDEDGFNGSIIPDDFEPHEYFNPRTAIPLGKWDVKSEISKKVTLLIQ